MSILKGIKSKEDILEHANQLFNEKGLAQTFADLARELKTTQGRITYHFPTKDHLFIALAEHYEAAQRKRRESWAPGPVDLQIYADRYLSAMDIQYRYRCVIRYLSVMANKQGEVYGYMAEAYKKNREIILDSFRTLINVGSLKPGLMEPDIINVVLFQFTCLFTTWVINLEIYDPDKTFEEVRSTYFKGIFSVFAPYLTAKGREELNRAGIPV